MKVPVILLVFNRPEKTAKVFEAVRGVSPSRLHVVSDGPRADVPGEAALVERARQAATAVDWPCELTIDFSPSNLGCRARVSSGLSAAFENFDRAIVLEDDCLPHPSFFRFCEEMLERYATVEEVMHVGGTNFLPHGGTAPAESYYFSRLFHIWGWATWRRAWKWYDPAMADWPEVRRSGLLREILPDASMRSFWSRTFDLSHARRIDSWDHQWAFACLKARGFAVTPAVNLVANIGFDAEGTHTAGHHDNPAPDAFEIPFPLHHPSSLSWNRNADLIVQRRNFRRRLGFLHTWMDLFRRI